ncbi:hypothetical protein [Kutzneria sp. NPDC051319]|uniref:hypothetical protein n=1 Tax=Kutzneria sp. NPDC051319 TaxID=3155047 RepID=UPI0034426D75
MTDLDEFFRTSCPRLMARAVLLCGDRADNEANRVHAAVDRGQAQRWWGRG